MFTVKAMIKFRARSENELTIRPNDILTVLSEETIGNSVWYTCRDEDGETGMVLKDYVQKLQDYSGDEFEKYNRQTMTHETSPSQYNSDQSFRRSNSVSSSISSFPSTISSVSMQNESFAPKYSDSDSMAINEWLILVEMDMENISDSAKIAKLRSYLEGDARSWYAQEIARNISSMSWDQCKELMITRFSSNEVRPIISAIHRIWRDDDTIKKYYRDKMAYLSQIDCLPSIDKVALLTDGMPLASRIRFTCAEIIDPPHWLRYGSQLETQLKFSCERTEKPKKNLNNNREIVSVTDVI